jgi:hypothetical protein
MRQLRGEVRSLLLNVLVLVVVGDMTSTIELLHTFPHSIGLAITVARVDRKQSNISITCQAAAALDLLVM